MMWTATGYTIQEYENIHGRGFDVGPERKILIEALEDWISMQPVTQWSYNHRQIDGLCITDWRGYSYRIGSY